MTKFYSLVFASILILGLGGCQSLEQISIDYLEPGDVSFPAQFRKVAIVNNTSSESDSIFMLPLNKQKTDKEGEVASGIAYFRGESRLATEALAEEIAKQNYFESVIICDSALRSSDNLQRENRLSQEEVQELSSDLGVDFIISLEDLQFKATKAIHFIPEYNSFKGTVDVKAYPTVSIYLPNRSKPMTTLHLNDSIFWEDYGGTAVEAISGLISDKEVIKEASDFAGTVPVKSLVPMWKTDKRYIYTGGSVQMRDAAVYVRENSWDNAYELWNQVYNATKKGKKKMMAALNIAVYYEMKDSIDLAEKWANKAQQLAMDAEKIKNIEEMEKINSYNMPEEIYLSTLYVNKLKERNSQLPKLKMQMERFNDDF